MIQIGMREVQYVVYDYLMKKYDFPSIPNIPPEGLVVECFEEEIYIIHEQIVRSFDHYKPMLRKNQGNVVYKNTYGCSTLFEDIDKIFNKIPLRECKMVRKL